MKKNKKLKISKKAKIVKRKKSKKARVVKVRKTKATSNKIKKSSAKKVLKAKAPQPWGVVTHYYGKIGVAIVKLNSDLMKGAEVSIIGATTNFSQAIESMQLDHQNIEIAKKGMEVGIIVKDRVREGDALYGVN